MSLIDSDLPPGTMDSLPDPLIPLPGNIDLISDIFSVGPHSSERWRGFIDCKDWNPKRYNEKLLVLRAYNARMCWECASFLSISEADWVSINTIEMVQETAHFELRKIEIEIVSFQLTSGMLGLDISDLSKLFQVCVILYTTTIWLNDKVLENGEKNKERRKAALELQENLRPYSVDSVKRLGVLIDRNLFAIFKFISDSSFIELKNIVGHQFIKSLGKKLKNCILQLDDILIIVP